MAPNHMTEFADALVVEDIKPPEREGLFLVWQDLGKFRESFTKFLAGKNHAFIGGVVARSYKARVGPTFDYDVLIAPADLQSFHKFLESAGGQQAKATEETWSLNNLEVDVRIARSNLDREALELAKGARYAGLKLRIVTPEHFVAMKVKAFSERGNQPEGEIDRRDVLGMLKIYPSLSEQVRAILSRHRPDLISVFEGICSQ